MADKVFLATGNKGKIKELSAIAREFELPLVSPASFEFSENGPWPEVKESHNTYLGNALEKARAWCDWSGLPTVADDSGLEVLALDGFPGVRSARWAGEGLSDQELCTRLLEKLEASGIGPEPEARKAQFKCSLVCVFPEAKDEYLQAEGILRGHILNGFQGEGGFGYDPVVMIDDLGKTLAEIDFSDTLEVGFRANAARQLFEGIKNKTSL